MGIFVFLLCQIMTMRLRKRVFVSGAPIVLYVGSKTEELKNFFLPSLHVEGVAQHFSSLVFDSTTGALVESLVFGLIAIAPSEHAFLACLGLVFFEKFFGNTKRIGESNTIDGEQIAKMCVRTTALVGALLYIPTEINSAINVSSDDLANISPHLSGAVEGTSAIANIIHTSSNTLSGLLSSALGALGYVAFLLHLYGTRKKEE